MGAPKILFLGQDLYDLGYISGFPTIEESSGWLGRGNLAASDFTFSCRNTDSQFSIGSNKSFLNGVSWQYKPIVVYDDEDNLIFDGIVQNISRNHQNQTATIICKDNIVKNRKTAITYTSSSWETAADAVKNICDNENISYDSQSITTSSIALDNASCYVKVNINKEDNISALNAINSLAPYGAADVFMKKNKLHYRHWQEQTVGSSISLSYDIPLLTPRTLPVVDIIEQGFFNDYSISYLEDGDDPETDSGQTNSIGTASRNRFGTQSFDQLSNNSIDGQVVLKDAVSAKYIGDTIIKRGHFVLSPVPSVLQKISFDLPYKFKSNIELGTVFKYTFSEEGWNEKLFEVITIQKNLDTQNIGVTAWEKR